METWKILMISLVAAIILGVGGGIAIGKYMLRRVKSPRKPLLSKKERIIYSACILIGTASVLFGVFFRFPTSGDPGMNNEDIVLSDDGTIVADSGVNAGKPRRSAARAGSVTIVGGSGSVVVTKEARLS